MAQQRFSLDRVWMRMFGDGSRRSVRMEKVISYVAHRLDDGARLDEALQDEYVRRQTSPMSSSRYSTTTGSSRRRGDGCTGSSAPRRCRRGHVRGGTRSSIRDA